MSNFGKTWTNNQPGIKDQFKMNLRPEKYLKSRMSRGINAINNQSRKLDNISETFKQKDAKYYKMIVSSLIEHDKDRAAGYANELAEIRKNHRNVTQVKLALEQISLRISTAKDVGDIATIADTNVSLGTAPAYTGPTATSSVVQAETYIRTDEDIELVNGIQTQIGRIDGEYQKLLGLE